MNIEPTDDFITLRESLRPLDCGHLHCRYCSAGLPEWIHSEHCPYARSVVLVERARAILDRWQIPAVVPLWREMESADKTSPVLLFAPDLIDEDFNPTGSIEGYWLNDHWEGAVWCAEHDHWEACEVKPTHWMPKPAPPHETVKEPT